MGKFLNKNELTQAYACRKIINKELQKKILNKNFTIISSNCIGSMIYHDLNLQFQTPTVNMFFTCEDFVKFCSNIRYYLSIKPIEFSNEDYPILLLDDIKLFCQHYSSSKIAIDKWEERKLRVNLDNLYIIATDRNCNNLHDLKKLDELPYKIVIFTCKNNIKLNNAVIVKGYNDEVGHLDRFINENGEREYEKYFDFISWLNS